MLELRAVLTCDRCYREVVMEDVDDLAEAERRAHEHGWCESEDGEMVCAECWFQWDATHKPLPADAAVDPPKADEGV